MNITIVCDVLGKENNGTTIAAMNLIRSLRAKGHQVKVVCPDRDRETQDGFYVIPTYNLGFLNNYVAKNGVALAKPDRQVIENAIDGADVVHIMIPFAAGHAAAKIAMRKNIPVTAGFHCQAENFTNHIFLMNAGFANRIAYRVFYQNVYRHCDGIHYPTQFICDVFEKQVGPTNHFVISNGVSRSFKPGKAEKPDAFADKFVIVFTGRYSKEKSHRVLIEGVARCKYNQKIQLIFAGSGPQEKKLKQLAARRLANMPVFRFFSRQELIKVLNYADLYVHPAEIEIEAISCLEAIACGLVPVISNSPRSATRYFAMEENNLFRCNDADDLARKLEYWIEHPRERRACGKQYEGFAAQFDYDLCMGKMEHMFREIAAQSDRSAS